MRPLSRARRVALEIRASSSPPAVGSILDWVRARLRLDPDKRWTIEVDADLKADAVLDGLGRRIKYHPRVAIDPTEFRRVLAHELGHFMLHPRLRSSDVPDALGEFASEDLRERTSRFDWEEADAEAFAYELLCPAADILAYWSADPNAKVDALAARFDVSRDVASVQLARALADSCDGSIAREKKVLPACTPEQRDAAHAWETATYVDAGPGTGKTRTLIERVRWLVDDKGVCPEKILVLSFSNSAVGTVRERLLALNGDWGSRVTVSTVHSLAGEILRRHRTTLGYERPPTVLDEAGQSRRVRELLSTAEWPALLDPFQVVETIRKVRGALRDRAAERSRRRWFSTLSMSSTSWVTAPEAAASMDQFESALSARRRADHEVTFDELLDLANKALDDAALAKLWQERYRHVVVDEAQDLAPSSLRLILALAPPEQPAWFAGDHRQRICGFQGADPNIIPWIRRFYGDRFREPALGKNHRTEPAGMVHINDIAGAVDPADLNRWQSTRAPSSGSIVRGCAKFEVEEKSAGVRAVVGLVTAAVAANPRMRSVVVLTRHNADAASVVRALRRRGVAAFVPGGLDIDDVAGDLATVLDPKLLGSVASEVRAEFAEGRLSRRAAVDTVARVRAILAASPPRAERSVEAESAMLSPVPGDFAFDALVRYLFDDGHYLRRLMALDGPAAGWLRAQVATILLMARGVHGRGAPGLHRRHVAQLILAHCSGAPPTDPCRGEAIEAVRVMTIHQAKGREFEHVIALLTAPKQDDAAEHSPEHRWTSVACEAFVAASRGTRRTEFVVVNTRGGNPFATTLAILKRERALPAPARPETRERSFAAGTLWSPPTQLGVDGGFWRTEWCAMTAFVRSTLRVRSPGRDERLQDDALRLLRACVAEGLIGVPTEPTEPRRYDLPPPWTERIERLAGDLCSAIIRAGADRALAVEPWVLEQEGLALTVRLPLAGVRSDADDRVETVILLAHARTRGVDSRTTDGLADAVRYYLGGAAPPPKQIIVITNGAHPIDHEQGTKVLGELERTMVMSGQRTKQLTALREGNFSATPDSYGCGRCSARLLCPAYHLTTGAGAAGDSAAQPIA